MRLYVATHNSHKIAEISKILEGVEIVPDNPEGVEENAPDFAGNALIKVRAIAEKHKGEWCMADDSGLEVKALGGAPGVHSARYAGEPCNTPANNALLLKNLEGVKDRAARFTCCCALVDPSGEELVVHGHCLGHIAEKAAGVEGFGYDPLFIPNGYDKSFAELSADEKNAISHRGRALGKVKVILGGGSAGDGSRVEHVERVEGKCGSRVLAWLRLFRVVNLPTVPGDVLVGAAAVACSVTSLKMGFAPVWWTAVSSVLIYMFGLVQNDILGAKTDKDRPIPDGLISIRDAKFSCAACWFFAWIIAWIPFRGISGCFWLFVVFIAMTVLVSAYNATKKPLLMGLCRALNMVYGGVAVAVACASDISEMPFLLIGALFCIWTLYITLVTWYSKGEENDPEKKRRVGALVGAIVYLQLLALVIFSLLDPSREQRCLLVAGGALLVLLRSFKVLFPKVSAS